MIAKDAFPTMIPAAARFYQRVFNNVLLNIYAVKTGDFDKHISDITEVNDIKRWNAIIPVMVDKMNVAIQKRNEE